MSSYHKRIGSLFRGGDGLCHGAFHPRQQSHRNLRRGPWGTGIESWLPLDAFPDTAESSRLKALAFDPEMLQAAWEDQADFKVFGRHQLAKWSLGRAVPASLFEGPRQPD